MPRSPIVPFRPPVFAGVVVALLALPCSCVLTGPGVGTVTPTPQRPSISHDAALAPTGTLEVETGIEWDPGDRADAAATIRHGLDERSEVFVGLTAFRYVERPGSSEASSGFGDVVFGLRHVPWRDEERGWASALQLATKVPTADAEEGLGSGESDVFLSAALVADVTDRVSLTNYYGLGLLGDPDAPGSMLEHTLAGAGAVTLDGGYVAQAELAGRWIPEESAEQVFATAALAREIEPGVVLDIGVRLGLTSDADDMALLVGWTTNYGRVR